MRVIKKKIKGTFYSFYKDEKGHQLHLGKSGSEEEHQRLNEIRREEILAEIKRLKKKLEKIDAFQPSRIPLRIDESNIPINQIIEGDALQELAELPEGSIHFAVTSPPYNLGLPYDVYVDAQEYGDYRNSLKKIWKQTFRVLIDGGRFALNIAPTGIADFKEVHHDLVADVKSVGFMLRTEILWYKQNMGRNTAWGSFASPSNPHIVPSWEYVYVFHKKTPKLEGVKPDIDITPEEFTRFSDGFWRIQPEIKRNGHPAPFPEELIERLIKFYTYRGNICLDMFGGTGTAALLACRLGRKYISIDISKQYCETARERLGAIMEQKKAQLP